LPLFSFFSKFVTNWLRVRPTAIVFRGMVIWTTSIDSLSLHPAACVSGSRAILNFSAMMSAFSKWLNVFYVRFQMNFNVFCSFQSFFGLNPCDSFSESIFNSSSVIFA
jgi:hypothetical protein